MVIVLEGPNSKLSYSIQIQREPANLLQKSIDSPLAEKQLALDYLVHLVGDLPLPLDVGFLDDLGGTQVKVTFEGKTQTLHELWDSGMLDTENRTAQAMTKLLD